MKYQDDRSINPFTHKTNKETHSIISIVTVWTSKRQETLMGKRRNTSHQKFYLGDDQNSSTG